MSHYDPERERETETRVITDKKIKSSAYHSGNSEADNAQTPQWVISQLESIANLNVVHDVCATDATAKAESWWTKKDDSLIIDWSVEQQAIMNVEGCGYFKANDALWMNPPFSLAREFTIKAANEAAKGVVTLGCVKHAPDADWFIEMERRATAIYVPDGRIQFLRHDGEPFTRIDKKSGEKVKSGANFPVCFPLWTPFNTGDAAKQVRFKRNKAGFE